MLLWLKQHNGGAKFVNSILVGSFRVEKHDSNELSPVLDFRKKVYIFGTISYGAMVGERR
jgi:hypothetical protein